MTEPKEQTRAVPGWVFYCDGCGEPTRLPGAGRWHCPRCGNPLWLQLPENKSPQLLGGTAVPLGREAAPVEAVCASHPQWRAAGICERCGDFRCNPCTRVLQGRFYCVQCFAQIKQPSAARSLLARFPHVFTMVLLALLIAVVQIALRLLRYGG